MFSVFTFFFGFVGGAIAGYALHQYLLEIANEVIGWIARVAYQLGFVAGRAARAVAELWRLIPD